MRLNKLGGRGVAVASTVGVLTLFGAGAVSGASVTSSPPEPSIFDRVWSAADLYKNDDNPVVQRFQITGRLQLDYAIVNADQDDHEEFNVRRFRLGFKSKLARDFALSVEADFNPQEPTPFYTRLTDANLAWSRNKAFVATIGKQKASFTLDGSTSSKELLTIDRSNLANNLWFSNNYFTGLSASGQVDQWRYFAGLFSSGEVNREFGEFSGGAFGLASLGYDFAKALDAKLALLSLNYVCNEPNAKNNGTRNLGQVGSLNFKFEAGKWGVYADVSAGEGYLGQSDLWGAMLTPFYNFTSKLQIVTRLTHVESKDPNGVRLTRYETSAVSGRGNQYDEVYLGLNYYIYGHKLKVQTGVHHAEMSDRAHDGGKYSGWAWTTGLRLAW